MDSPMTTGAPSSPVGDHSASYGIFIDLDILCDSDEGTLAVLDASCTVLGIVFALFLILIVSKNRILRGDKYLLLNHLVVTSTILLAIAGFVYTEQAVNPCWSAGRFICKMMHFLKVLLTDVSTFTLICLSAQQFNRHRGNTVTVFNSTHTRCVISVIAVWCIALIVSVPEFIFADAVPLTSKSSLCYIVYAKPSHRSTVFAKVVFVEYIIPLLVLLVITLATGIYVAIARSQFSTWGTTTGGSLHPRDRNSPRHFALTTALAVVYTIGYFPLYSVELATFVHARGSRDGSRFWWDLDVISGFVSLLPPALTPPLILFLSRDHFDVLKSIYRSFTVTEVDESLNIRGDDLDVSKVEDNTTEEH